MASLLQVQCTLYRATAARATVDVLLRPTVDVVIASASHIESVVTSLIAETRYAVLVTLTSSEATPTIPTLFIDTSQKDLNAAWRPVARFGCPHKPAVWQICETSRVTWRRQRCDDLMRQSQSNLHVQSI